MLSFTAPGGLTDFPLNIGIAGDPGLGIGSVRLWCRIEHVPCAACSSALPAAPVLPAGQTYVSQTVFERLAASNPDVVLLMGDLAYAGAGGFPSLCRVARLGTACRTAAISRKYIAALMSRLHHK